MSEMLEFERKHDVEFHFRDLQMLLWKGHLEVILVQPPTRSRTVASIGLGQLQLCVTEHLKSARIGLTITSLVTCSSVAVPSGVHLECEKTIYLLRVWFCSLCCFHHVALVV